jgi:glycosyltransferase involved in cell wall biosynthesis
MRILQVTPYFAPAWAYGGPPRIVYELSRELVRSGHSVTVLTSDAHDGLHRNPERREEMDGIRVVRLKNMSNYLAWHDQLFLPRGTSRFLHNHLREFDLVHLHMYRTYQNLAVHAASHKTGVPYVFSAHGSLSRIMRRRNSKAIFDALQGNRVLRDARRLIAVSNAEREQYEAAGVASNRISVVGHGIDNDLYRDLPSRGSFANPRGLEGKRFVTYIGRLNARKGLEQLLAAFRDLAREEANLNLLLVGPDDGYGTQVRDLVRRWSLDERVILTGLVTMPDKLAVLVDSDVVVYPSAFEIFGLVPFEALLCGRPIVVANDSGCGELVERARAGFTVPFGNPLALRNAIAEALRGGPEVAEMTQRGREFVLENLSWSRVTNEMMTAYDLAVSSSRK